MPYISAFYANLIFIIYIELTLIYPINQNTNAKYRAKCKLKPRHQCLYTNNKN